MNDIIIYGAGGFGREVASMINRINDIDPTWHLLGFADDGVAVGECINGLPVLGGSSFLNNYKEKVAVVVAVGSVEALKNMVTSITNPLICFPSIIDPTAVLDPTVTLGNGNIITYSCFLSCNVTIGDFNVINTRCSMGHDSTLGSFNILNPNVQISGNVNIGDETFWGLNSCIIQGINVANHSFIGACSLILRSIKEEKEFYFGVPAVKQRFNR